MKPHPFFKKEVVVFEGEIAGNKLKLNEYDADGFMNKINPNEIEASQIKYLFKHFAIYGPQKYPLNMLNRYFLSNKDWNHPVLGNLDNMLSYISLNWSDKDRGLNLVKAYLESIKSPEAAMKF
jgi:hypothetical protein